MLEVLAFSLIGILLGIFSGLAPGIHPNFFAVVFYGIPFFPSAECFISFMSSLAIANSLSSFIPAIFLGSPDESSALSITPGHAMLRRGMGHHAVRLSVIGGVGAIVFCALTIPVSIIFFPKIYSIARSWTHLILFVFCAAMILSERRKLIAAFLFISSGLIGILGEALPVNPYFFLFPVLSGLFGVPVLLLSIRNRTEIPEQTSAYEKISRTSAFNSVAMGSLAGIFVGLLPGVGPSQAAFIADSASKKKRSRESFIMILGSVSAANTLFSMLALWLIGNPRSGIAVAIGNFSEIGFGEFLLILSVSLLACGVSAAMTLRISGIFSSVVSRINYPIVSIAVVLSTVMLVLFFTGLQGLILLMVTSSLGIFANLSGASRSHMMGVLIIPTILFFAGL